MGESSRPRKSHKLQIAGANPASASNYIMKNIWVLSDNIDIVDILKEVESQSHLWTVDTGRQQTIYVQQHTQNIKLVNAIRNSNESQIPIDDVQTYAKTQIWDQFPTVTNWLQKNFPSGLSRVLLIKLLPEKEVYTHVDAGSYYRIRTRFHLALKGTYAYHVGNETLVVNPGTLFCFNNSLMHSSQNLKNEDRISIMFDVEHTSFGLGLTIINDG